MLQDVHVFLFSHRHDLTSLTRHSESHEVTVLVTPAYPEVAPRCIIRPTGVSLSTAFFDQNLKVKTTTNLITLPGIECLSFVPLLRRSKIFCAFLFRQDIEVEVNSYYEELVTGDPVSWDWILSHQLRRLQVGLDSIKESAKMGSGGQSLRGRNRRQPLAFSAAMQTYFHR